MKFLQRLMGGGEGSDAAAQGTSAAGPATGDEPDEEPDLPVDGDEQARELALLKEEHRRLDDLAQRQQRYAEYAWQPPKQGGDRRADDQAES